MDAQARKALTKMKNGNLFLLLLQIENLGKWTAFIYSAINKNLARPLIHTVFFYLTELNLRHIISFWRTPLLLARTHLSVLSELKMIKLYSFFFVFSFFYYYFCHFPSATPKPWKQKLNRKLIYTTNGEW